MFIYVIITQWIFDKGGLCAYSFSLIPNNDAIIDWQDREYCQEFAEVFHKNPEKIWKYFSNIEYSGRMKI